MLPMWKCCQCQCCQWSIGGEGFSRVERVERVEVSGQEGRGEEKGKEERLVPQLCGDRFQKIFPQTLKSIEEFKLRC